MGMCSPEDHLFTPLLQFARVPFQAKESVHKTPFWENLEILASTASVFAQILALKLPRLEIFSSQAPKLENFQFTSPPFQRQISVRKPHTLEIQAAHPYLKKSCVPPPRTSPPFSKWDNFGRKMRIKHAWYSYKIVIFLTDSSDPVLKWIQMSIKYTTFPFNHVKLTRWSAIELSSMHYKWLTRCYLA